MQRQNPQQDEQPGFFDRARISWNQFWSRKPAENPENKAENSEAKKKSQVKQDKPEPIIYYGYGAKETDDDEEGAQNREGNNAISADIEAGLPRPAKSPGLAMTTSAGTAVPAQILSQPENVEPVREGEPNVELIDTSSSTPEDSRSTDIPIVINNYHNTINNYQGNPPAEDKSCAVKVIQGAAIIAGGLKIIFQAVSQYAGTLPNEFYKGCLLGEKDAINGVPNQHPDGMNPNSHILPAIAMGVTVAALTSEVLPALGYATCLREYAPVALAAFGAKKMGEARTWSETFKGGAYLLTGLTYAAGGAILSWLSRVVDDSWNFATQSQYGGYNDCYKGYQGGGAKKIYDLAHNVSQPTADNLLGVSSAVVTTVGLFAAGREFAAARRRRNQEMQAGIEMVATGQDQAREIRRGMTASG